MELKSSVIQQREKRIPALIALGVVSFLWGTTWVASRQGVKHMPAIQLAGIRQFLAGFLYTIYFIFKGAVWPKGREWLNILVLSALNLFLTNGLTTLGVKYISGGLGSIIAAIFPLWLVIIGLSTNKPKVPTKVLIGLLLGFGGICVIFYEHLRDFFEVDFRFGIMISLIASVCWSFGTLYTKKQAKEFNPYFSIGLQMVISGVLLFGISTAAGWNIPMKEIPAASWIAIFYLVIFGSVIAFACYLYALQNLPTAQLSIYAYINPIVAVLFGSLLFGEKITLFIGIGGLITLYGVYLVNSSFLKKNKR
jgi:drug/metabolite transporter (DMT)-like permease